MEERAFEVDRRGPDEELVRGIRSHAVRAGAQIERLLPVERVCRGRRRTDEVRPGRAVQLQREVSDGEVETRDAGERDHTAAALERVPRAVIRDARGRLDDRKCELAAEDPEMHAVHVADRQVQVRERQGGQERVGQNVTGRDLYADQALRKIEVRIAADEAADDDVVEASGDMRHQAAEGRQGDRAGSADVGAPVELRRVRAVQLHDAARDRRRGEAAEMN